MVLGPKTSPRQDESRQDQTRQEQSERKARHAFHMVKHSVFCMFSMFRHTTGQDKTRQDKTKKDLTGQDKRYRIHARFLINFSGIFGSLWDQKSTPNRPKKNIAEAILPSKFDVGAQEAPRGSQEAPKRPPRGPQEAPKRAQEAPKRAPRGPKRPPRRSQVAPKRPQVAFKRSPRLPKWLPRGPKRPSFQKNRKNVILFEHVLKYR